MHNIYLHYQCDLDSNHVYAEQVNFKNQSSNNCIYFDEVFTKEYLFKNIDYLEEVMESIAEKCKAINNSIKSLEMMKDNLLQHAIPSEINKKEKRKTVRALEDMAEFVESLKII